MALALSVGVSSASPSVHASAGVSYQRSEIAEEQYLEAVAAFGDARFGVALELLADAETKTIDPMLRARIYRQRGIIEAATDRRAAAVSSFLRALRSDPNVSLNESEHREEAIRLFRCATVLSQEGLTEHDAATLAPAFEDDDWLCPDAERRRPIAWPLWTGIGVTAVAIGAGTFLGTRAVSLASDVDPGSDPRPAALGANVAFGIAALTAAGVAGWWLWTQD